MATSSAIVTMSAGQSCDVPQEEQGEIVQEQDQTK